MATGVLGVFFFIADSVVLGEVCFLCICLGGEELIVFIAAGSAFCSRWCLLCFIPMHVLGLSVSSHFRIPKLECSTVYEI